MSVNDAFLDVWRKYQIASLYSFTASAIKKYAVACGDCLTVLTLGVLRGSVLKDPGLDVLDSGTV